MSVIQVNWKPPVGQLRAFGWIATVVFGGLGSLIYIRHHVFGFEISAQAAHVTGWILWVVAGSCLLLSFAAPGSLRPLYVGLMVVSLPIGFVVSHVILAILFYGIITPIALIMRLIGRDAMDRALRPDLPSYWREREPVTDMRRYFRQS
ncbi:MAG: SxtJ family membrane protein [Tepidisphaeraceae bacterium]